MREHKRLFRKGVNRVRGVEGGAHRGIKDERGEVLQGKDQVCESWREQFELLLNEEGEKESQISSTGTDRETGVRRAAEECRISRQEVSKEDLTG